MINPEKEYVLCAAIWYKDGNNKCWTARNLKSGQVICGYRHDSIISVRPTNPRKNGGVKTVQGFLTSRGNFYDRYQAMEIAYEAGQVPKEKAVREGAVYDSYILEYTPGYIEDAIHGRNGDYRDEHEEYYKRLYSELLY